MTELKDKIVLTGFMGAGKSTVGKALAEKCSVPFYDTDRELEKKFSNPNVFDLIGEEQFRIEENIVLNKLLDLDEICVISTGGGAFAGDNIELVNSKALSIYIFVPMKTAWKRVNEDDRPRPMIDKGFEFFQHRWVYRSDGYRQAHIMVGNEDPANEFDRPIDRTLDSIFRQIKHKPWTL